MSLPETALRRIFSLLQTGPLENGIIPMRTVVSHVSRKWRILAIGTPSLWVTIRITPHSKLDGLQEILYRSGECELDITFASPTLSAGAHHLRLRLLFRDATILLRTQARRWKSLTVNATSDIVNQVVPLLNSTPLLRLQSLELIQNDQAVASHFGPLVLNPITFRSLRLHRVTVHCMSPSHFAGLTELEFSQTSCRIIDQALADLLANLNTTTHPPSMHQLQHLVVASENPLFPQHPSFSPSTLVSLKFMGLYSTPQGFLLQFTLFFNSLASATLAHLELEAIHGVAWDAFLTSLQAPALPKYPGLRTLTFRTLELRNIDIDFISAFPAITHLALFNVDSAPLAKLLRENGSLWRDITITIDGNRWIRV